MLLDKHKYKVNHAFINISFPCIPQILKANKFKLNPIKISEYNYSIECCNRYTNNKYPWFGSVVMCLNIKKLSKNTNFVIKFIKDNKNKYKLYILSNTTNIVENIINYIDEFIINEYYNINSNTFLNYNIIKRQCSEQNIIINKNIIDPYILKENENDLDKFYSIESNSKYLSSTINYFTYYFRDLDESKIKDIISKYDSYYNKLDYIYLTAILYLLNLINYNCLFYSKFIMPGFNSDLRLKLDEIILIIIDIIKTNNMSSISILKDRIIKSIELWHNKAILLNRTNLFEFENNLNLLFSNNKLYNNSIDIFINKLNNYIVKNEID